LHQTFVETASQIVLRTAGAGEKGVSVSRAALYPSRQRRGGRTEVPRDVRGWSVCSGNLGLLIAIYLEEEQISCIFMIGGGFSYPPRTAAEWGTSHRGGSWRRPCWE
jgi:hypothetical protein